VKMTIDTRTHRKGWRRTTLLNYIYLAASELQRMDSESARGGIQKHLNDSLEKLRGIWGQVEYQHLAQLGGTLPVLLPGMRAKFEEVLGVEKTNVLAVAPLADVSAEDRARIVMVMGEYIQNETYRQVLLGAISELWIDYLTRMEALRVSIGLESYAQRDPLVMYKARATELFGNLLREIREAVISRMFMLQFSQVAPEMKEVSPTEPVKGSQADANTAKKKKRHRH